MTSKYKVILLTVLMVILCAWGLLQNKDLSIQPHQEFQSSRAVFPMEVIEEGAIELPQESAPSEQASLDPLEKEKAEHESGIPHECLESIRLGAENKLPEPQLSEEDLKAIAEKSEEFDEAMIQEFENFIVSDDGEYLLDKKAITEDFERAVELKSAMPSTELEVTRLDDL